MYSIDSVLQTVEDKWLSLLFNHCKSEFSKTCLPSHDESHHYRVWLTAKRLIGELGKFNYTFTISDIEKMIIAAFFHDIGMSVDPGPEHGSISRKMAEDFFTKTNVPDVTGLPEICDVIAKHDDKEYKSKRLKGDLAPDSLFPILNVSDDLDALGITGIYRYAEIYLLRGVAVKDLGFKVLRNLEERYKFFTGIYGFLHHFCSLQNDRYQIIQEFYNNMILHQDTDSSKYGSKSGPAGVIGYFQELILDRKMPIKKVFNEVEKSTSDAYILDYFHKLSREFYVKEDG